MSKYTVDKSNTATNVKNAVKAEVTDVIIAALKATYGEDNVFFVRTGNGESKKNELAVITGMADVDGAEVPVCATVNAASKDFTTRVGTKKTFEAFDVYAAKEAYEAYLGEKAEKEAEKAAKKAKKAAE